MLERDRQGLKPLLGQDIGQRILQAFRQLNLADHWCEKGHILLVLEGELETELADGRRSILKPGQSYQVADGAEPHRSRTGAKGARLFIVD